MEFGLLWLLLIGFLVSYHLDLLSASAEERRGLGTSGVQTLLDPNEEPMIYGPPGPNNVLYFPGQDDLEDTESGQEGAEDVLQMLFDKTGTSNGRMKSFERVRDDREVKGRVIKEQDRRDTKGDEIGVQEYYSRGPSWDMEFRRAHSKGTSWGIGSYPQRDQQRMNELSHGSGRSWRQTGSSGSRLVDQDPSGITDFEQGGYGSPISKRTVLASTSTPSSLWSCTTDYGWKNLGPNHYPQYVRTANCSSTSCFNEFFHCAPVSYNISVLRKLGANEVVDPSSSFQLPSTIRDSVKFINVSVNTFCECRLGRSPSNSNNSAK